MHLFLLNSVSKQYFSKYTTLKVDVIAGDANGAAYKYNKRQEYQDLHSLSVAIMLREMRREVNTGRTRLRAGFALIILPMIILNSVAQQVILNVA